MYVSKFICDDKIDYGFVEIIIRFDHIKTHNKIWD